MNTKQRFVIVLAGLALVCLGVFPPWKTIIYGQDALVYREAFIKHAFVLSPPSSIGNNGIAVDLYRLLVLIGIVIIAALGMLWVFAAKAKDDPAK